MVESNTITNGSYVGQTAATPASNSNSMGKDEFLKLLTVQMQNQDPMSPMESQDFSAQIAQFTQVEKLDQMSGSLSKSNEIDLMLTQAITNTISTTMVGKRAKVNGNQVMIKNDGEAEVSFSLNRAANNVKIKVKDEDGNLIKTIDKGGMVDGKHTVEWDGRDKNGSKLSKDKTYTFEVAATDVDGKEVQSSTYMVGIIQGVEYSDNSTMLILNTGQKAPFSSVLEVMAAEDY